MRSSADRLVLRLQRELDRRRAGRLNGDFGDIVVGGAIERVDRARRAEVDDDDVLDLPRIAFRFDRSSYARLRRLIDRLNGRR